jgi:hypothetical protein
MVLVRDLTGDGAPDSIVLLVTGRSLDSGRARVEVRSRGTTVFSRVWSTSKYLGEGAGGPFSSSAQRDAYIRKELQSAVTVSPMTAPDLARLDSVLRSEVRRSPVLLALAMGYEDVIVLAWSRRRSQFVVVESCC